MPFSDIASDELSLSRLLRLSLFQVSVGMALVLLVGTLNRVMIVELDVPAWVVGSMLALPLVFAPFRALIGYRSDTHRCELGWRRVPFIWKGTLWQFGGFAIMPFALLVLAGEGESGWLPDWVGQMAAGVSFLLVGAGVHTVQTAGLALATDLTPRESHPRVVGLMYTSLLSGMIVSALAFGAALEDFSPGRLIRVIQAAAVVTVFLNMVAIWQQEVRRPLRGAAPPAPDPSFLDSWKQFCKERDTVLRLVVIGVGTMAFGMADILLEPFGGQVLDMAVGETTRLTALLAFGGLLGFALASRSLGNGTDAHRVSRTGALIGLPAFAMVIAAAPWNAPVLFLAGNFLIGFGGALFGHGTLTSTMNLAPKHQAGLALGAWGAVQATAAGLAMSLSGIVRDVVNLLMGSEQILSGVPGSASGYLVVYAIELVLLLVTIAALTALVTRQPTTRLLKAADVNEQSLCGSVTDDVQQVAPGSSVEVRPA